MRMALCVWLQLRNAKGSMRTAEVRLRLQKTMQRDAAVFRTQESLENGVKAVDEHYKEFQDVKISDRSLIWNTDLLETLELQNIMDNALITMYVPRSYSPSADAPCPRHMCGPAVCRSGAGGRCEGHVREYTNDTRVAACVRAQTNKQTGIALRRARSRAARTRAKTSPSVTTSSG